MQSPSQQESRIEGFKPSPRRICTLDIETVALDPHDGKGALDAKAGRIVCIGMLFDDGEKVSDRVLCHLDEKVLLEQFWFSIRDNDLLVGHNILGFDLMFIRQRSWILGVRPPVTLNLRKYYTDQVVDIMEMWTNWGKFAGAGLDAIASALGVGSKTGHGSEVAGLWANRQYKELMDYCMSDVWLTYRVYCRLHYREPLSYETVNAVTAPLHAALPVQPQPQRELVPVRRVAAFSEPMATNFKAPVAPQAVPPAVSQNSYISQPQASPAPAPRRSGGKRGQSVTYMEMGGALVLSGATFPLKDALPTLGGQRSKDDTNNVWIWQLPLNQFNNLAGLCAKAGIRLVAASDPGRAA